MMMFSRGSDGDRQRLYTSGVDDRLTRLAVTVNWRGLALGHEVFETEGATFVRNTQPPRIYDANFVFGATVSERKEIERLLLRAAHEYAHASRVTFRVDLSLAKTRSPEDC